MHIWYNHKNISIDSWSSDNGNLVTVDDTSIMIHRLECVPSRKQGMGSVYINRGTEIACEA